MKWRLGRREVEVGKYGNFDTSISLLRCFTFDIHYSLFIILYSVHYSFKFFIKNLKKGVTFGGHETLYRIGNTE